MQLFDLEVSTHKELTLLSKHFESLKLIHHTFHVTLVALDEVLFSPCHRLPKHRVDLLNRSVELEKNFVVGFFNIFVLELVIIGALQALNPLIPLLLSLLTLMNSLVFKPPG